MSRAQAELPKRPTAVIVLITALAAVVAVLAACSFSQQPSPAPAPDTVTAHVWNVGEALSVFIDDENVEILIDAGNDRDGAGIVEKVAPYVTDGTIEYVIATHSHADHIGGMEDVYAAYQVTHTIYGDTGTTGQFKEFMDAASAEPGSAVKEDVDEVIALPSGATLAILDVLDGAPNTNNNSVVSVLEADGHKMLVTGDAEDEKTEEVLTALVARLQNERLYSRDVYIVGHHGSETSSSAGLLSLINPAFALISSEGPGGQNKNPDITVMERLSTTGATVFSTYRSGDMVIEFGQDGIKLSPPESERLTVENYRDAA
jgi:competence protein ComEC